jgi:hypothetical protein
LNLELTPSNQPKRKPGAPLKDDNFRIISAFPPNQAKKKPDLAQMC